LALLGVYGVDSLAFAAENHALEYGVLRPLIFDNHVTFGYLLIAIGYRLAQILQEEEEVFLGSISVDSAMRHAPCAMRHGEILP
jgi:hypothetical protein